MALGALGAAGELPGTAPNGAPGTPDIRVVIVDDSSVVRFVLSEVVRHQQGFELAGVATNGQEAISVVEKTQPDVVVMDIEMPVLDGLGALKELKKRWPRVPVIMFSTLTEQGGRATLAALAEGAEDYLTKPTSTEGPVGAFNSVRRDLVPLLRTWGEISRTRFAPPRFKPAPAEQPGPPQPPLAACTPPKVLGTSATSRPRLGAAQPHARGATVTLSPRAPGPSTSAAPSPAASLAPASVMPNTRREASSLRGARTVTAVVMGSSTGGPNALAAAVPALPPDLGVPVLLVQHMPPTFTKMLAERLNNQSRLQVVEAQAGMPAEPGYFYVAPGGIHMVVRRSGHAVSIELNDGPPENFCKPSVDVLFRSAASTWGGGTLGVVLTGMGHDGLAGSRAITETGGQIIAQDEESSVVWGMPGAVTTAGVALEVVPIQDVAAAIVRHVKRHPFYF